MEFQSDAAAARGLRRYVQLVGEALALTGTGSYVELEQPAAAYLALDQRLPQYPSRDAVLLWHQEQGWALAVESDSAEDLVVQRYLGGDVLPPPRLVARFALRLVQGEETGKAEPPDLRTRDVDGDLPERLAAYALPADDLMLSERAASDLLNVRVEHVGPGVVLHVSGELDVLTAPSLRESVNHALAQCPTVLVLDLTGVQFISSAAMAVLVNANDGVQGHDRIPLRLVADGRSVRRPLEIVGLDTVLTIYPTVHAALADPVAVDQQSHDH